MKRRQHPFVRAISTISGDMALLQNLLEGGFLGVLEELSGALLESTPCREFGLSKASIQEHMEVLIPHLHQSQETADRQAILTGLEAQYFNNAVAKPVSTSTCMNFVQLRPPRRDEPKVNREEHAEHLATKKFRKF